MPLHASRSRIGHANVCDIVVAAAISSWFAVQVTFLKRDTRLSALARHFLITPQRPFVYPRVTPPILSPGFPAGLPPVRVRRCRRSLHREVASAVFSATVCNKRDTPLFTPTQLCQHSTMSHCTLSNSLNHPFIDSSCGPGPCSSEKSEIIPDLIQVRANQRRSNLCVWHASELADDTIVQIRDVLVQSLISIVSSCLTRTRAGGKAVAIMSLLERRKHQMTTLGGYSQESLRRGVSRNTPDKTDR
jgi:hypothetical protein